MTEREPIQIKKNRRALKCKLNADERTQRSEQVHAEIDLRRKEETEHARLTAEMRVYKERASVKEEEIKQRQGKIDALSEAARTGEETREVDVLYLYDPTKGEVAETREDTKEVMISRKPTAQEWDAIKEKQQQSLTEIDDIPKEWLDAAEKLGNEDRNDGVAMHMDANTMFAALPGKPPKLSLIQKRRLLFIYQGGYKGPEGVDPAPEGAPDTPEPAKAPELSMVRDEPPEQAQDAPKKRGRKPKK